MISLKTSDLAICAEVSHFFIRDFSDQGLLGPIPRSVSSSYRSFDPRLIPQVYLIKALRDMGLTSQQLKEYGQNRTPASTIAMFRNCCARLSDEISMLQARMDILQSYTSLIEEGQSAQPGQIEVRELAERPIRISCLERFGSSKRKDLERINRAHGRIRYNGNAGCPLGYAYNNFFELLEEQEKPAQLVSYDPRGPETRPAGRYLVGTVPCHYGEKSGLVHRMFEYALHNNLEFCGPAYTVYLHDAASVTEREQYLLQVTVAVNQKTQEN